MPGDNPGKVCGVAHVKKGAHGGTMVSPVFLNRLIQLQIEGSVG